MAFMNEYISDEDIKNYEIEKVWLRHNAQYIGKSRPTAFRFQWTIDRDRNIYFMVVAGGGRADHEDGTTCVLNWQGKQTTVRIDKADGSSANLNDNPFKIIWELLNTPSLDSVSNREILGVLKEGLTTYGYEGARRQVPNTIVEFKF